MQGIILLADELRDSGYRAERSYTTTWQSRRYTSVGHCDVCEPDFRCLETGDRGSKMVPLHYRSLRFYTAAIVFCEVLKGKAITAHRYRRSFAIGELTSRIMQ